MSRVDRINEHKLTDLPIFQDSPEFTELEKRVLRFATALTHTPAEVPEELFRSLHEHLDAQQIVELTAVIAWENFRARFNRGFGVEAEGFGEGSVCQIHGRA